MIGETTIDAVDYREGTDPPHVRKLSGLTKYGNITLKWGITVGAQRARSVQVAQRRLRRPGQASSARRSSSSCRTRPATDAARFVDHRGWPIKYDPSDLNAKGNEVMIELLELANEGIERVK